MRFNVEVRISYRSREMPEDTALALDAVRAYVAQLTDLATSWCFDAMNRLDTAGSHRWATVLSKADRIARKAATKGWTDPSEAEVEITILPGSKPRTGSKTDWGEFYSGLRGNDPRLKS